MHKADSVSFNNNNIVITLQDGRIISAPLYFYPKLEQARDYDRGRWELSGAGTGIHWPTLDEDLSVEGILLGKKDLTKPTIAIKNISFFDDHFFGTRHLKVRFTDGDVCHVNVLDAPGLKSIFGKYEELRHEFCLTPQLHIFWPHINYRLYFRPIGKDYKHMIVSEDPVSLNLPLSDDEAIRLKRCKSCGIKIDAEPYLSSSLAHFSCLTGDYKDCLLMLLSKLSALEIKAKGADSNPFVKLKELILDCLNGRKIH